MPLGRRPTPPQLLSRGDATGLANLLLTFTYRASSFRVDTQSSIIMASKPSDIDHTKRTAAIYSYLADPTPRPNHPHAVETHTRLCNTTMPRVYAKPDFKNPLLKSTSIVLNARRSPHRSTTLILPKASLRPIMGKTLYEGGLAAQASKILHIFISSILNPRSCPILTAIRPTTPSLAVSIPWG